MLVPPSISAAGYTSIFNKLSIFFTTITTILEDLLFGITLFGATIIAGATTLKPRRTMFVSSILSYRFETHRNSVKELKAISWDVAELHELQDGEMSFFDGTTQGSVNRFRNGYKALCLEMFHGDRDCPRR